MLGLIFLMTLIKLAFDEFTFRCFLWRS